MKSTGDLTSVVPPDYPTDEALSQLRPLGHYSYSMKVMEQWAYFEDQSKEYFNSCYLSCSLIGAVILGDLFPHPKASSGRSPGMCPKHVDIA